ncbi:uncharacterized protein YALI1_B29364g [Yarrowia lipolytica]|uniref:Uncharacterized protein n=1 Tax=Yarrowia lipolytica TaxID=4952 RepID=A0A1D8N8W5_YARLL|nr:hypothetical protein YALI1_B29364g [Yarrowia lipolytica]
MLTVTSSYFDIHVFLFFIFSPLPLRRSPSTIFPANSFLSVIHLLCSLRFFSALHITPSPMSHRFYLPQFILTLRCLD